MKLTVLASLGIGIALALGGVPAFAHHAATATYLHGKSITVEGTLKEFLWRNPHSFMKVEAPDDKGVTQCVLFPQRELKLPPTKLWKEGKKIVRGDNSIPRGTVIATFVDGKYSKLGPANQHTAIYLGQNEEGIQVLNQHRATGKVVVQTIPWKPRSKGLSNDGNAYSVVER